MISNTIVTALMEPRSRKTDEKTERKEHAFDLHQKWSAQAAHHQA
jgi:hypothetical protein